MQRSRPIRGAPASKCRRYFHLRTRGANANHHEAAQQSCWLPSPQHASTKVPKQRLLLDFEPRHQHRFKLCCARTVSLVNHSFHSAPNDRVHSSFSLRSAVSMGFWDRFKADSKQVKPKADEDDTPHSPVCNKFNHLSPKQTNYIDGERLEQALGTIFRAHGTNLNFGLKVCKRDECHAGIAANHQGDAQRALDFLGSQSGGMGKLSNRGVNTRMIALSSTRIN
jgi:hypothetical protein